MLRCIVIGLLLCLTASCGGKNIADCKNPTPGVKCQKQTQDEQARVALDSGDMDTAVKILTNLVANEPTNYDRYPLLAAALAGRSGFDVFGIVQGNFGGGTSLLQSMQSFIPTPVSRGSGYDLSLADMKQAVATLTAVPVALRKDISASSFAASCTLQLVLYQTAYSVMLINKYAFSSSGYDPTLLSKMSATDALAILSNLAAAGALIPGGQGAVASAAVLAAIAAIEAEPGATDQDKIAAYVQASHT